MTNILQPKPKIPKLKYEDRKVKRKATVKSPTKKKKHKKGGRYHTGTYTSSKCKKPINFRSGWEEIVCRALDRDSTVLEYFYEDLIIGYKTRPTQIKVKKYIVDFYIVYNDGRKKIVEVKADNKVNHPITLKKTAAAIDWCSKNNVEYEIWSNQKIKQLLQEEKQHLLSTAAHQNTKTKKKEI